jgi:diketogulonate reductase-like aldo/keto reductase
MTDIFMMQWSKENNILLQAYSPLGSTQQVKETLSLPEVPHLSQRIILVADNFTR